MENLFRWLRSCLWWLFSPKTSFFVFLPPSLCQDLHFYWFLVESICCNYYAIHCPWIYTLDDFLAAISVESSLSCYCSWWCKWWCCSDCHYKLRRRDKKVLSWGQAPPMAWGAGATELIVGHIVIIQSWANGFLRKCLVMLGIDCLKKMMSGTCYQKKMPHDVMKWMLLAYQCMPGNIFQCKDYFSDFDHLFGLAVSSICFYLRITIP